MLQHNTHAMHVMLYMYRSRCVTAVHALLPYMRAWLDRAVHNLCNQFMRICNGQADAEVVFPAPFDVSSSTLL